jgi:predicted NUDIX family NTP pyrophosphohydrolase
VVAPLVDRLLERAHGLAGAHGACPIIPEGLSDRAWSIAAFPVDPSRPAANLCRPAFGGRRLANRIRDQKSAGLLVWRRGAAGPEFLLAHPGGPFWARRDAGAWSIPKGLIDEGEDPLAAARREFAEETGLAVSGAFIRLVDRRLKSGKTVLAWLVEADLDLTGFCSNSFEMEWPRGSGRRITAPECDRAAYFDAEAALAKVIAYQRGFIEEAAALVSGAGGDPRRDG